MTSEPGTSLDSRRAELVRRRLRGTGSGSRIEHVDRSRPLRLSPGQEQMWFLQQLRPGSAEYLVPVPLRLSGGLDVDALGEAWDRVVAHHEILRTRYGTHDGVPVQIVDEPASGLLGHERAPGPDAERRTEEIVGREATTAIDLEREWPSRALLVERSRHDHVLILMLHHIACDGWSTRALLAELAEGYSALVAGRPPDPPRLPVQYADFAAWQRAALTEEDRTRQLGYWTDVLSGVEPCDLPTAGSRPPVRGYAGAQVGLRVDPALASQLTTLAQEAGATLFVLLLTAFQAMLARYVARCDVTVGTIASRRTEPELQHLVGYAVNTLAIRTRWSGEVSFRELLDHVREIVLDAFDNSAVPFADVVNAVEDERDLSRTPVFQVVFTMHDGDDASLTLPGVAVRPYLAGGQVARCDLELQAAPQPDGSIAGRIVYATELFDRGTVERMAGHLTTLLARAADAPHGPVSGLDMLDDAERVLLTRPARPRRPGPVVPARLRARVATAPNAPAVIAEDGVTTAAELDATAERFARALRSHGVGPERVAGVLLDRGPCLIAGLLATWKAGGAYLPIGPELPAERQAYLLADSGACCVLTERRHEPALRGMYGGPVLVVEDLLAEDPTAEDPTGVDPLPPAADPSPLSLAYVIYTSGSTGRPKGVQITHGGLACHLEWVLSDYIGESGHGAPLFSTLASDVVVPVLFGPMLAGLPVHVLPQDMDLSELGPRLRAGAPFSFVKLTPRHLDVLAGQLGDEEIAGLASTVVPGGDMLTGAVGRRWDALLGDGRVVNEYGPTEITVGNSTCPVAEAPDHDVVPLGRPIPGTSMYLLDERLDPVPVGVVGEVCVGGDGVARGYVGRPGATAERFVPDPFGPPGSRLYRTGDLGTVGVDGLVSFAGRCDRQVKIRGFRVEPGEIEGMLSAHEHVAQARVLLSRDGPRDPRLVAYVVAGPDAGDLLEWLRERLPEYMVPADLVLLDRLPLTANGKLDEAALPTPDTGSRPGSAPPGSAEEERMAAVWSSVLGVQRVGVRDGFFELGGDSIKAVALVGALREAGFDVSVRDVFAARTVTALCAATGTRPGLTDLGTLTAPFSLIGEADRARVPAGVTDAYPLCRNQIGMLFEMLADDQNRYHNVTSFRILDEHPFAPDAMRRAVAVVTDRHEVLRTSMHLSGYSVPMQLVHAAATLRVVVDDLDGVDPDDPGDVARRLREHSDRERAALFDLETPGLLRFCVHPVGADGYWLSVTECHPILEGWGHHTLIMELLACYEALRDSTEPPPFDRPAVRFADFVAEEMAAISSPKHRAYWQQVVDDYAPVTVPPEWGDPEAPVASTHQTWTSWRDLEPALRARASEADVSLKSVMLAAYAVVAGQLTDEPAFHAGLVCDARPERAGADRVYGMYLNTVAFPVDRGARTWRALLRQVFEREVQFWPHRGFPLPEVARLMRDGARPVNVLFNYQDFNQVDTRLVGDLTGWDDSPTEFPLSISSRAGHVFVTVDPRLVSAERAEAVARMFRAVLEAIADNLDGDATATHLPPGERERLLSWGREPVRATGEPPEVPDTLTAFERRAWCCPDAVAVDCAGTRLSFAELDARAGRLAGRLRASGVRRRDVVGVVARRDEHLLVSLLATWKAGAAYVPLGTEAPALRWAFMLADCGARHVLAGPDDAAELARVDGGILPVDPADRPSDVPVSVRPSGGDAAYVIYTSGSTGTPKGVCVTHAGVAYYLRWAVGDYLGDPGGDPRGGAPLFSTPASDVVVTTLFGPLLAGRTVHVIPEESDLGELGARLRDAGPFGFVKLTPGHLEVLTHQMDAASARGLARTLVVGGDMLSTETARRWTRWLGAGARVVNEYGPTEITVGNSAHGGIVEGREVVPVGRPIEGTSMYVLDENLQPVPVGVAGELCVGGVGVARGYVGNPRQTAARFVPDPFGLPGARLYRTGDVARVLPTGDVDVLGRRDGQVKVRGYRVELGEIEGVLRSRPEVTDARVVQHRTPSGEQQLVAYVVAADPASPAAEPLRAHLAARLPGYMVPAAYVRVPRIPLTPTGKLDPVALPDPFEDPAAVAYTPPCTAAQERMAQVWSEVMGRARVGVEEDFFDLGGDSIRAVELVRALGEAGFPITVRELLAAPTIAALSPGLPSAELGDAVSPEPVADPVEVVGHREAQGQEQARLLR